MKIKREEQEALYSYDPITDEWNVYISYSSHIRSYMNNFILDNERIEVLTEYGGKPTSISFTVKLLL